MIHSISPLGKIDPDLQNEIATYLTGEFFLVSKDLTRADLTTKLVMLQNLADNHLDIFADLTELKTTPINESDNLFQKSSTINNLFRSVLSNTASFLEMIYNQPVSIDTIYSILKNSEKIEELKEPVKKVKQEKDNALKKFSADLRDSIYQLPIPEGSAEELRAWFADEANQEFLLPIKTLNLSHLILSCLPDEIGKFKNLTNLTLSNSNLLRLPSSIGNLIKLTDLNLTNNKLNYLPSSIGNLTSLINLEISYNALTYLPISIGSLISLKNFNIHNNTLASLPDSIVNLVNLKALDVMKNPINFLPSSITKLIQMIRSNNKPYPEPDSLKNFNKLYIGLKANLTRIKNNSSSEGVGGGGSK